MNREDELTTNITMLLNQLGSPSKCVGAYGVNGCGEMGWWLLLPGKNTKVFITSDARNHLVHCPKAKQIEAARKAKLEAEKKASFDRLEGASAN